MQQRTFEDFYESEFKAALALARVLTGDIGKAEDVTHEAFVAALEAWDDIENPAAWIRRVISNRSRSAWRRHYAERRAVDRLSSETTIGTDIPQETEDFWSMVRSLPGNQARAIALFYMEDMPVSEVAEVLGCKESTARVHLTRGRRKLAKMLGLDHE